MDVPKTFPWNTTNTVHFLVDGRQFYPSMLNAIKQAKQFILMEMYLFESSNIADQFITAFTQASRRGLTVQLLLDAYGCLGLSRFDREKLTKAGVQLSFYNPLRFKKFKQNLFRTHRKYLIIDGEKVFVGGVGITDSFAGKNSWRETVIEVQGPIVADWQTLFSVSYAQYFKEITPKPKNIVKSDKGEIKARLAFTNGGTNLEIKKDLVNRINNSHERVWFASAYFIPSRKIRKALRNAAAKGKDVRLLLPGPVTDHPSVRHASRRYYARLLRFNVRIFEYQERFTHTKMVLIDDWFTIGSSNMDRWNFRWNREANQEIMDETTTIKAREILLNDFKHCDEIKYQDWLSRSKYQRLKEWIWGKVDIWLCKKFGS